MAKAADLAKLGDERGVRYLERPSSLTEQLLGMLAGEETVDQQPTDALATLAPAPEWRLRAALTELRSILSGPSIQVRCLECGPVTPTRVRGDEMTFTQALLGWLGR